MSEHNLHPSVQKFKEFVKRHPSIKEHIRKDHKKMQHYYEKWMILGEDDPYWDGLADDNHKERMTKKEWMKQFGDLLQEINWEDVSKHIDDLNGAIGEIQQLISNVQQEKQISDRRHPMKFPYY
ncbi:YlbD family protein [Halobacillus sp. A5]|uniref:YlbD family protein n=1 Tax=Halobacillus sp. A5 TaxID=2880263 RepID=UPI0020A66C2E|nr:YlbD family protein [Halobacillus sp. A5]MCP3026234.1 YlbD family protein [Halobacillus sp. A5]